MSRRNAMFAHMLLQQRIGPKFIRIAQLFGLLTRTMLNPGDRVIRNAAALARSRQFTQGCLQPELKELADAESDRVAIDTTIAGDRSSFRRTSPAVLPHAVSPAFLHCATDGGFPVSLSALSKGLRFDVSCKPFWQKNVFVRYRFQKNNNLGQ